MNICKRCGEKEAWICVRCINDLVDWLDSLPITTDETRQRVKKAFESLNEEGAAGEEEFPPEDKS
jgi:hypothetical protein